MGTKAGSSRTSASAPAFRIVRLGEGKPHIARVHHESSPRHSAEVGALTFLKAQAVLQPTGHSPVLLAGAGFGMARMEIATELRCPSKKEFEKCVEIAEAWLESFSKSAGSLRLHALFGLDIYAACKRSPSVFVPVAQFVAHFDPEKQRAYLIASKRLPTSEESAYLYCGVMPIKLMEFPKSLNITGLGKTLPLICHDMNVYNARGVAAQDPKGPQAKRREAIGRDLSKGGIKVAFAAVHSLWPSALTFKTSMKALHERHSDVNPIAAFGTFEDSLSRVLEIAERHTPLGWSTLELIPQSWPEES